MVYAGFKYNMTDIQAAIGIHQFPRVEKYWIRRKQIWEKNNQTFQDLPVFIPAPAESGIRHAYHLYTLILDIDRINMNRDQFLDKMHQQNIGTEVHYIAFHLHEFYRKNYGYKPGDFPHAEWISERTVSIPLSPKLTDYDVKDVIKAVKTILGE